MRGLFHVHSDYSHDGRSSLRDLVKFCYERCFDFIVLSEHAESFDAAKMKTYVNECRHLSDQKVLLIPGLEFGFREYPGLHLLGIGITEYIAEAGIGTVVEAIQKQSGLAVIAHPSRNRHVVPDEIRNMINGIEIWNAAYDSRYLPHHDSLRLYAQLKRSNPALVAFGGLDMHDLLGFRELTLEVDREPRDSEGLLKAFEQGLFVNKGKFMNVGARPDVGVVLPALIRTGRMTLNMLDTLYWTYQKLAGS